MNPLSQIDRNKRTAATKRDICADTEQRDAALVQQRLDLAEETAAALAREDAALAAEDLAAELQVWRSAVASLRPLAAAFSSNPSRDAARAIQAAFLGAEEESQRMCAAMLNPRAIVVAFAEALVAQEPGAVGCFAGQPTSTRLDQALGQVRRAVRNRSPINDWHEAIAAVEGAVSSLLARSGAVAATADANARWEVIVSMPPALATRRLREMDLARPQPATASRPVRRAFDPDDASAGPFELPPVATPIAERPSRVQVVRSLSSSQ